MAVQVSKKSGLGKSHAAVSELSTVFTILPGHEEQMRAACERFDAMLKSLPRDHNQKAGLREWRQVIIDGGKRLLLMTSFETDWDAYIDDAALILGVDAFSDWLQHTVEATEHSTELKVTADAARQGRVDTANLKAVLQMVQVPATAYFDVLSDQTVPEFRKAQRVARAFQQVLDTPGAEEALQHPAMKPLLDQAMD